MVHNLTISGLSNDQDSMNWSGLAYDSGESDNEDFAKKVLEVLQDDNVSDDHGNIEGALAMAVSNVKLKTLADELATIIEATTPS